MQNQSGIYQITKIDTVPTSLRYFWLKDVIIVNIYIQTGRSMCDENTVMALVNGVKDA